MTCWALLSSPLTGGAVWTDVAPALRALTGDDVVVVPLSGSGAEQMAAGALAALGGAPSGELLLVPHSNAGLYVAGLAASLAERVAGVAFVDALLPGPGPRTPVAPAALAAGLADRVDRQGLLPPWTSWWPEEQVAALFADTATRRRFEAAQSRVPASYLDETVATPSGWEALRGGYLGFGDAYREEQGRAGALGWPVVVRDGGHLHPLRDPRGVARDLVAVLDS